MAILQSGFGPTDWRKELHEALPRSFGVEFIDYDASECKPAVEFERNLSLADLRGEYFFKLGAMYGDDERWKESREMLTKALQKGGLKKTGEAWMRLAVAHYNLKDTADAQAALQKALNYDESRRQAGEWLRHLTGHS